MIIIMDIIIEWILMFAIALTAIAAAQSIFEPFLV
jgi:hypothetical protein